MSKPVLKGSKKYKQGIYRPRNPQKYIGNPTNIIYRSGWEKMFLMWCDMNPSIVSYGSEEMVVPYVSPLDNKMHRYFVDFVIVVRQSNGSLKKFAIEIKPYVQTKAPRITKNMMLESVRYKLNTWAVNQAKWEAAKKFCSMRGMEFVILTEKQLLKGNKK